MSEPMTNAGMPALGSAPAPISMSPTTANQTTTHEPTSEAQETFTGAPEPEPVSEVEQSKYEGGVKQSETQTGTGTGTGEEETQAKLPFKEQVKAYAKVHRGTLLGDKETKQTGQKILAGEISPEEATTGTTAAHK